MVEILQLVGFESIISKIENLKKEYESNNDFKNVSNFFVFPEELSKEINSMINEIDGLLHNNINIKDKYKNIISVYDKLSIKIYEFFARIKESSFENKIFKSIKENIEEIINFFQKTDKIMDKLENENNSFSGNLFENMENENKKSANDIFTSLYNNSMQYDIGGNDLSNISNNEEDDDGFLIEKYTPQKNPQIKNQYKNPYSEIIDKFQFVSYYANIIVKNEIFNSSPLKTIKNDLPNSKLEFLFEYKNIIDDLIIKQCKISKEKLNYRYNFIIPNLTHNFNRGGEIYYPPYGWFGVGLNAQKLYKNYEENNKSEKAIAYYSFYNMTSKGIQKELNNIIMNKGLVINKDLQPKFGYYDKRKKEKKVGYGIYLSPKINIIEGNTGIIHFKNKSYKIALMVSVLAEKIRQPDENYWVLNPEDIEINKIIFKEIFVDNLISN